MNKLHGAYAFFAVLVLQTLFLTGFGVKALADAADSLSHLYGFLFLILGLSHAAGAYLFYRSDPTLGFKILAACGAVLIIMGAPLPGMVTFALSGGLFWITQNSELYS